MNSKQQYITNNYDKILNVIKHNGSEVLYNETWCGLLACYANDLYFASELRKGRSFEEDLVRNILKPIVEHANVILDIGGHVGMHTVAYHKLNSNCKIYVFEPQMKLLTLLKLNCARNQTNDNIIIMNNCVGHKLGEAQLTKYITDGPNTNLPYEYGTDKNFNLGGISLGKGGEPCNMLTIDSLELEACDYIKIDVEGFEPLVLLGGVNTIKKFHPKILFECNHKTITNDMREYFDFKDEDLDSFSILRKLGYSWKEVHYKNYLAEFDH